MSEPVLFLNQALHRLEEHVRLGVDPQFQIAEYDALITRMRAAERAASLANEIRTGHISWKYFKLAYDEWKRICGVTDAA